MNTFKVLSRRLFSNNTNKSDLSCFKKEVFGTIANLKNYNLRDYYHRRFEYDFQQGKFDSFTEDKLKEVLVETSNLVSVQNIYFIGNNMVYSCKENNKL